jgi:hypothetical protein
VADRCRDAHCFPDRLGVGVWRHGEHSGLSQHMSIVD